MTPKLPITCPSCSSSLNVSQLACPSCSTTVSGNFPLPVLLRLSQEEQDFILQFFLTSGSLKEMASQMGISYPTVRNRLDDLISKIKQLQNQE
ncbi:DUF2089 domain-containing protein [Flavobacterium alkalisoli]|uniref:DUF2089 domain-containing protein n=1 Tax=Flavobacterium alkalisoli TaxID=2602769 RepID=A0A5B9FRA3_9FLAO|nr:DUF2089 family protein [Flavobacterium alkalisoli]QEE49494.1 DUF2089 domain-containing protein [Flavobacterium alkalisoli]